MNTSEIIGGVVIIAILFGIVSASDSEHAGDRDGGCGCLAGIVVIILFLVMACSDGCNSKKSENTCSEEYVFTEASQQKGACSEEADEFDEDIYAASAEEAQREETPSKEVDEFEDCIYTGPTGEPQWEGTLPQKVNNYTEPRYVYENLVESTDFLPENGRIIGYRISPTLVIHSRVQNDVNPSVLGKYVSRFGGKLLQEEDVALLRQNWEQVSKLRIKAGDTPLSAEWFWGQYNGVPFIHHYKDSYCKDVIGFPDTGYPLILKR